MNIKEYNKLSDLEKRLFGGIIKSKYPNKRQTYTIKFTHRQLELIHYACELSREGRSDKDQNTLNSVQDKIDKLNIDGFSTNGID